jgi:hypothetical protein
MRKQICSSGLLTQTSTHDKKVDCAEVARAHNFGQFKTHALLKARTQSPCFSYPGLARAFISEGSADLLSFGGVSVSLMSGAQFTVLQYLQ